LRGAGDTRVPVLITAFGMFVVRLPLAYLLTFHQLDLGPWGVWPGAGMGLLGAWTAMFVDLAVRGLFLLARFASGRWRRVRV
jgi:Na+-driven multidrug efflux pump